MAHILHFINDISGGLRSGLQRTHVIIGIGGMSTLGHQECTNVLIHNGFARILHFVSGIGGAECANDLIYNVFANILHFMDDVGGNLRSAPTNAPML